MSLRACSTAAAVAVPSPGTWLRRCARPRGRRRPRPRLGRRADSPVLALRHRHPCLVPPSGRPRDLPDMQRPSPPGEGPFGFRWSGASVALVPPRSSVLPPGAGNEEAKKALKAGKKRAKKIEEGYALGLEVAQGHGDAAAIGRHDDGDRGSLPWKKSKRPDS